MWYEHMPVLEHGTSKCDRRGCTERLGSLHLCLRAGCFLDATNSGIKTRTSCERVGRMGVPTPLPPPPP